MNNSQAITTLLGNVDIKKITEEYLDCHPELAEAYNVLKKDLKAFNKVCKAISENDFIYDQIQQDLDLGADEMKDMFHLPKRLWTKERVDKIVNSEISKILRFNSAPLLILSDGTLISLFNYNTKQLVKIIEDTKRK